MQDLRWTWTRALCAVALAGIASAGCSARPKSVNQLEAHVTGLTGSGLVLVVNDATEVPVASAGTVDLGALPAGTLFTVAVRTQPTHPPQRCTVDPATGTRVMPSGGATVEVSCVDDDRAFSGQVQGLLGSGLVLELALGDRVEDVTVPAQAVSFAFSARGLVGDAYRVEVKAQPSTPAQTCSVQDGGGTVGAADVQITVVCSTQASPLAGSIDGLRGHGLVLLLNGAVELEVPAGATTFAFPPVADGSLYVVAVKTQPLDPVQRCEVGHPTGTMGLGGPAPAVTCVDTYGFAAHVDGLAGEGLSLTLEVINRGTEVLTVDPRTPDFAFGLRALAGERYGVSVSSDPAHPAQRCTVTAGAAAVVGNADAQVRVQCATRTFVVSGAVRNLLGTGLTLLLNGAGELRIPSTATGFAFPALADGSHFEVTVATQPTGPSQRCAVSLHDRGDLAGADVTDVEVSCETEKYAVGGSVNAAVTGPVADGLVLQLEGGETLTVPRGATTFRFATPIESGVPYKVSIVAQPTRPQQRCALAGEDGTVGAVDVSTVAVTCHTLWKQVAAGQAVSAGIAQDGTLWTWGFNYDGQLGVGDWFRYHERPVQVGADRRWAQVSISSYNSLFMVAVAEDGTLWSWGKNDSGQLGIGSLEAQRSPKQVTIPGDPTRRWRAAAAGAHSVVALAEDGTLWSWGYGGDGALGTGNTATQTSPAQIAFPAAPALKFSDVSAGYSHVLALGADGSLWSWGSNLDGELGNSAPLDIGAIARSTPAQVNGAWTAVSAGGFHSLALRTGGALWAWGLSSQGQLGDPQTADRTEPAQLAPSLGAWSQASGGTWHTAAIAVDGTLWVWGDNTVGQLGPAGTPATPHPVSGQPSIGFSSVAAGYGQTLAIAKDGTLWGWGDNNAGDLGIGTVDRVTAPTPIW